MPAKGQPGVQAVLWDRVFGWRIGALLPNSAAGERGRLLAAYFCVNMPVPGSVVIPVAKVPRNIILGQKISQQ